MGIHVRGAHPFKAHGEVEQLTGLNVRAVTHAGLQGGGGKRASAASHDLGDDASVYEPHVIGFAVEGVVRHAHDNRAARVPLGVKVVPHLHGFGNMGVSVEYSSHHVASLLQPLAQPGASAL